MVNETIDFVLSEATKSFALLPGFTTLIRIFQTAGIIFIAYLIFLFFKGIINYKRFSKINNMDKKLDTINQTLLSIDKKLTGPAKPKPKK